MNNRPKTPYAVICPTHKQVFLTEEEYEYQLDRSDQRWFCPICTETASWDDDNYENAIENGEV